MNDLAHHGHRLTYGEWGQILAILGSIRQQWAVVVRRNTAYNELNIWCIINVGKIL